MRLNTSGLTTALAGLSQTQLDELETFWEIDPDGIGTSAAARTQKNSERLAAAMATVWAAMAVVEKLSEPQRQGLRRLLEGPYLHDTAFEDLGETPETLLRPLLEHLVLLIVHSWSYGGRGARWAGKLPLAKDAYVGIPGELQLPLERALELYDTPVEERLARPLRSLLAEVNTAELAGRLGIAPPIAVHYADSLPGLVAGNLRRPDPVQKLHQQCSPRARRLFSELLKAGRPALLRNLLSGPSVGAQEVLPLLAELHQSALVFPIFVAGKRACFVPESIADAARGVTPQRPAISDTLESVSTPAVIMATGQGIWWDMMVAGLSVEAGGGDITATTHEIPKKVIKQLARTAAISPNDVGDAAYRIDRAFLWLTRANLIELRGGKLQVSESWQEWRTSSLPAQAAMLLNGWIFDDTERHVGVMLPGIMDSVRAARRTALKVLRWLQELPPGEWFDLRSFLQRILAREPYFLRSREAILALMGEAGIDDLYESWRVQEGVAILNEMFNLPLYAGLVEVGWVSEAQRRETPAFFRVPQSGGELLQQLRIGPAALDKFDSMADPARPLGVTRGPGRAARPVAATRAGQTSDADFTKENAIRLRKNNPPEERVLVVQPNLEVLLLRLDPRAAYAVGRFAQPVSFDQVGSFRITGESVRSAASRGVTFAEMKATLDRYGTGPTPQNVEYQINDWVGTVRRVRFERGTVVEVDSPEDLETLLGSKSMRSRLIRRLSPTAALISVGEDVQALAKTLEPQGFSWTKPEDWELNEESAYSSIHKTLKRFEPPKSGWGWR